MKQTLTILILILCLSCQESNKGLEENKTRLKLEKDGVSLILLGTIQDAGSPHIACKKDCCKDLFDNPDKNRQVISLGLVDNKSKKKFLFEATPDISRQMKFLEQDEILNTNEIVDGIFLTHAHIGHYAGLMYLGKEATDAKNVDVYSMPIMKKFLETNGPWDQLVNRKNIILNEMESEHTISLSSDVSVTPFIVPHRDEYSETVGYKIQGPQKSALFIPDIDKWSKWEKSIVDEIKRVDYAFLDATFYSGVELDNRDITQIPHPFIIESLETFKELEMEDRKKIVFIHFNHTNPVINLESEEAKVVIDLGYNIGRIHEVYKL